MLYILLMIFKFIGILIVSLLGILLFLLLLILCVPIRYRLIGRLEDNVFDGGIDSFFAEIRASWLLRFVCITIVFQQTLYIRFKLFGICFYDNKRPKKVRKKRKKKTADEEVLYEEAHYEEEHLEQLEHTIGEDHRDFSFEQKKEEKREEKKEKKREKKKTVKKESRWARLKQKVLKTREKLSNLKKRIFYKLHRISDFIDLEENKTGFKRVLFYIKRIMRHVLPTKLKAYVRFGLGDPCLTGQVLGGVSLFFPLYRYDIRIVPEFEERVAEGDIFIKGRIRFITLLIIIVRIWFDKECRKLYQNIRNLKEEL